MRGLALAFALGLCVCGVAQASPLAIQNDSKQDIINVLIKNPVHEIFLRLDLLPGAQEEVDNPECSGSLRVDTGFELWHFANVDLAAARGLIFSGGQPPSLLVRGADGGELRVLGEATQLVPQDGAKPVCSLGEFHPAMAMKDVCAILPDAMPRDDNGALLAGLEFAGLPWAARLVPDSPQDIGADSRLAHLELRRPLSAADLERVAHALFQRGYAPWQADLPGLDIDFGADAALSEREAVDAMLKFIQTYAPSESHQKGRRCHEASLLMAPRQQLPLLKEADEPPADVQLFTIFLRPCADALVVDVAAYSK